MGDCHASPHLAEAQRLATEARSLEEVCNVAPPPVAAKPVPVEAPKPVVPTREELKIPRNVHFALDKHFISAESRRVIEGIAALLNKYPSIKVRLEGHTDSRASVAYNLALSQRRVNATKAVFLELGIDSTRMSIDFKGKGDLYAEEKDTRGFALNRRVEMVFVDPDGRDIQSERQEGDLQLEGATPVKPKAPAVRRKVAPAAAKPGAPKPATPKP
jgi:outer membrane protein OmpA-like peptidoglycan-associated protein